MRRALRVGAAVVLVVVGACALLAGGALTLLRTRWGGDWVRRQAVPRVNAAIAGSLEVGRFRYHGDLLQLGDVVLRDPDGGVVVRVRALDIGFSPLALFRGHVDVHRALIDGPGLWLRQDAQGTNLGRALAPRHPQPASNPGNNDGPGRALFVELHELRLSDGLVEVTQAQPGHDDRVVRAGALSLAAHGRFQTSPQQFTGDIDLRGGLEAPLRAPLALRASAQGQNARRDATISASLGDTVLDATAQVQDDAHLAVRWTRLHVTPDVVRAFVNDFRLAVPVDVTGQMARDGAALSFAVKGAGAAWNVDAHGEVDTDRRCVRGLSLVARDVDLGATVQGLPRSHFSLKLDANGGGTSLADLDGKLDLQVPEGTLDGVLVAPSSIRVSATKGHFVIEALRLSLPGLAAKASGAASPERLALSLSANVTDLGSLTRAAAAFAPGVPIAAGRGSLQATVFGSAAAPGVSASAAFPVLAMGANRVDNLQVTARVPNVRLPTVGDVRLQIAAARLGQHRLRQVDAQLHSTPPRLSGNLRVAHGEPVAFVLEGGWTPDHQAVELRHLQFRYPQAAWRLARPARFVFAGEHVAVSGFELAAREGDQRLGVDLDKRGEKLNASVRIQRFDLSRLPPLLLPPGQQVQGHLDADVRLEGTTASPDVHAAVTLRDGRVGAYKDLSLALQGRYHDGRAQGTLDAAGLGTSVHAKIDAPTAWPLTSVRAPLALELTVPDTDIGPVLAALHVRTPRPLAGRVKVTLRLDGTGVAPSLHLDALARGVAFDRQPIGDVALHVLGDARTPLTVGVAFGADAQAPFPPPPTTPAAPARAPRAGGLAAGTLSIRTGLSLSGLATHPPTPRELARAHLEASGQLNDISLAILSRLNGAAEPWSGTASLRLSASGTPLAPEGALNVRVAGATGPRFPATDARLDAMTGPRDTRLALRIARAGHPLAAASLIWKLPSARLRDHAALAGAPLELTAAAGPVRVHRSGLPASTDQATSDELTATLQAGLTLHGTLARPELVMTASVRDGHLGKKPVGNADATLAYSARRITADARLRSASGGELHVQGDAAADLGYPEVTHLDAGKIPFQGRLSGQSFDLAWLSGLSRQVRSVAGQLSAAMTVRGTPNAPHASGQLEWTHGALTLTGLGAYRDVHLKAHGDENAVWLDELRLASGDGDGRLTAHATRDRATETFTVDASTSLHRFPIYGQGEALATVSVDAHATGTASAGHVKAVAKVSEAHVELNDVKQKKLQSLQRPADIVLVDGSRAADKVEAKRLAALDGVLLSGEDVERTPVAAAAPAPFGVHLQIDAPRNLWVHGKDASLELGLGPDFHVEAAGKPAVYGQVLVRRGRIDVFGRRFDLQAGSMVQFVGPADQPRLDVTAKYFNEAENISVLLTAKGSLDKLTIAVTSPERPDLTEGQLYTLIVTGKLQLGGSGNSAGSASASGEAASLVGGVVAAQLQKTLARKLPLDVLTLQAGDEGLTGSRLEAGTYLTSKLYAGYVGRVGANPALLQNRNAVHVEYQLSRRWSFDAEYGDVGTGTADLLWTKNY